MLHNAPAAVLVIDLDRQQVVYANTAAIALTGERVGLPVDVDSWSDAAGLTAGTLHYANAGHPAPLLLDHHGRLQRLDGHHSPMIGVVPAAGSAPGRGAAGVRCPPGSLLLLYTDGLTDVAGDDADARTALLERTVAAVPPGSDAETVVENVLSACLPEPLRDDVALLAVRLTS